MKQIQSTRHSVINGYSAYVFDNILSLEETVKIARILKNSNFSRTEADRHDTQEVKSWAGEIERESIIRFPIYTKTTELLLSYFPAESYVMYRSYCNVAFFGDMLYTHTDTDDDDPASYTALWFISEEWDVEWGGETLFFNDQGDAELAVTPKPGRLALFDGRILHVGRPPNRICYEPRFTVALKFEARDL